MRRGEIFVADFGTSRSQPIEKRRPALIVQNDAGNRYSSYVIVAAIHAIKPKLLPIHVPVKKGTAGLRKDCFADLGALATFRKNRLGKRIGALDPATMRLVDRALKISLGL